IVERGGRHILLTSREGIPPRRDWSTLDPASSAAARVRAVTELEHVGAHVRVLAADVSEHGGAEQLVAQNDAEGYPPIRGVIHAAGTALPKLLVNMDAADVARILKPKVHGAWFLHKAFAGQPLDFFTAFSSIASVVISTGQGNYSAGNAFLDALAHWRRAQGAAGLSINWGPWGEVGMATQLDLLGYFESHGLYPMTTSQGLEAMGQLCGDRTAQAVVIAADWQRVAEVNFLGRPPALLDNVLRDSAESQTDNAGSGQAPGASFLLRYSAEPDVQQRRTLLERHLTDLACRVLRIDESRLAPGDSLNSRGMDSMMAIELKNRIETSTLLTVTIVDLLRGASVGDVADRLMPELEKQMGTALDEEVAAIVRDGQQLSEAELSALLNEGVADEAAIQ
ncbi:MAG TPA: beta-ketoacyl reductase, partial [Bryobacteraceae bacterium]|nr:beta-ketoacyl reductase [Bryobacteraceae bacterium]